jgi:Na+-transporting methylmalonyl-CoA/oxaloacetate decarboxylase gamma subunit
MKGWMDYVLDWTMGVVFVCLALLMICFVLCVGLGIYYAITQPETMQEISKEEQVNDDSGWLTGFIIGNMLGATTSSTYRNSPSSSSVRSYGRSSFSSGGRR